MSNPSKSIYFENLNGLRFLAAMMVVIHHIEQIKGLFGLPNHYDNQIIHAIGKLGVVFFFVLSGFLITTLLLKEEEVMGTIDIKKFYLRRVLRIWPLYFLILVLAFFILPHSPLFQISMDQNAILFSSFWNKLILFVFMLPNLALILYSAVPFASGSWSIGAEEQFYLVWPVLMKRFKNKWVLLLVVVLIYLGIRLFLDVNDYSGKLITPLRGFLGLSPISVMAIGGLFALLGYSTNNRMLKVKKLLFIPLIQYLFLGLLIILIYLGYNVLFVNYEFYSILFGILLFNLALNPKRIFTLEFQPLKYLGKISYGLYMWHPMIIALVLNLLPHNIRTIDFIVYPTIILAVVVISTVSYELFENRFLKWKFKYTLINSGEPLRATTTLQKTYNKQSNS